MTQYTFATSESFTNQTISSDYKITNPSPHRQAKAAHVYPEQPRNPPLTFHSRDQIFSLSARKIRWVWYSSAA